MRAARAVFMVGLALWSLPGPAPRASDGPGAPGLPARAARAPLPFLRGVDISALPRLEEAGARFRDGRREADALALLAARGANAVRVRVWNGPPDGRGGLADAATIARRARALGLTVLLDLHLSDTWADPGHQTKPAAWRALPPAALADTVEAWVRDAVRALDAAGGGPDLVQVGNEIDAGLLWDDGRVGGTWDTHERWQGMADLLAHAVRGVESARPGGPPPRVVMHVADGGDTRGARRFFARLREERVPFDAAGVSFYPWWHGSLDDLRATVDTLATSLGCDVLVLETAYPWTLAWADDVHNLVGEPRQLLPGFAATPAGQRGFLDRVFEAVRSTPGGRGRGVFVWAPEWITAPALGSPWENCALFDTTGALLPAAAALRPAAGDAARR